MLETTQQTSKHFALKNESPELLRKETKMRPKEDKNGLDFLLSMETQARVDALHEKDSRHKDDNSTNAPKRLTTIKFELPDLPLRYSHLSYPKAKPYRSLPEEGLIANEKRKQLQQKKRSSWRSFFKEEEKKTVAYVTMGARVRLKMRPLPTFGYVKYIGSTTELGQDEWIGIELDHRVGNSDGSMNGKKYFITDHHRGIFCKRHEIEPIAE
ncbi:CAP Gly-rich domain-containing protein [Sporodiniella umbellata]|nr:CAP Gly-rich domain-containing protein [Sporodiniella umbellata]